MRSGSSPGGSTPIASACWCRCVTRSRTAARSTGSRHSPSPRSRTRRRGRCWTRPSGRHWPTTSALASWPRRVGTRSRSSSSVGSCRPTSSREPRRCRSRSPSAGDSNGTSSARSVRFQRRPSDSCSSRRPSRPVTSARSGVPDASSTSTSRRDRAGASSWAARARAADRVPPPAHSLGRVPRRQPRRSVSSPRGIGGRERRGARP